jgi:hypothetical protein
MHKDILKILVLSSWNPRLDEYIINSTRKFVFNNEFIKIV